MKRFFQILTLILAIGALAQTVMAAKQGDAGRSGCGASNRGGGANEPGI